jgi:uncharacterized protein (DUF302 family)
VQPVTLAIDRSDGNRGIVSISSQYSFEDTVQRLHSSFLTHGIKVFATIDQRAEAAAVGLTMPPTTLVIFGNPTAGTPLMMARPLCGIDLPLKVLVMEAKPGTVIVSYNASTYILERHSLAVAFLGNLVPAERLIADAVTK